MSGPVDPVAESLVDAFMRKDRVRGKTMITPDDKVGFGNRGRVVGVFKVCFGESGSVDSVTMIDSTSIPAYDAKIIRELEKWQFRPFQIRGRSLRACAAFMFIYSQV